MDPKKLEQIGRLPPVIMYPLECGCPCVFYPRGVREAGHQKPATCVRREDNHAVQLIEHRNGESVAHDCVRHVDDPYFAANPKARNHGAWDYARVAYAFLVPARLTETFWKELPIEVCWAVMHMTNQGVSPAEIAGTLRLTGLTKEVVQELVQYAAAL